LIDKEQVAKLKQWITDEYGETVHFSVGTIPEFNRRRPDKAIVNGYFALQVGFIEEDSWTAIEIGQVNAMLTQLFQFDDEDDRLPAELKLFDIKDARYYFSRIQGSGALSFISGDQVGLISVLEDD
jgi:hypothetical protein